MADAHPGFSAVAAALDSALRDSLDAFRGHCRAVEVDPDAATRDDVPWVGLGVRFCIAFPRLPTPLIDPQVPTDTAQGCP